MPTEEPDGVIWVADPVAPKKKRITKSKNTHEGWTQITDLFTLSRVGDVICDDQHFPSHYVNRCSYTETAFRRGVCYGYEVPSILEGDAYENFCLKQESGRKRRGYIWRPNHVRGRLGLNPIYSKPHPFFSR